MRTASILLAWVIVLGFGSQEAFSQVDPGPIVPVIPINDYTFDIGEQTFGFVDFPNGESIVCIGPLGQIDLSFTATQGLIGFCVILTTLVVLPVVLTVRWKKRAA
jgi:hypothetical protein